MFGNQRPRKAVAAIQAGACHGGRSGLACHPVQDKMFHKTKKHTDKIVLLKYEIAFWRDASLCCTQA
jgi:hypothetical protein